MIVETYLRNEYQSPRVVKTEKTLSLEILRDEMWTILEDESKLEGCPSQQFMLVTVPGAKEPGHYGCGSAADYYNVTSTLSPEEFRVFHPKYLGYKLHELWESMGTPLGRMILMRVPKYSSLPVSENGTDRLVAALWTQPEVYHLYENHSPWYHIPSDGYFYFVNGKNRQTIYNGTTEPAIYLMFELLQKA